MAEVLSNKSVNVVSPDTQYTDSSILSTYKYRSSEVRLEGEQYIVYPKTTEYTFKTSRNKPKLGIMLVGLGGNNGSTFVGGVLANQKKLTWETKKGTQEANFYGSITQSSTTKIGVSGNKEIFAPLNQVLPLADINNTKISGWDISGANLANAMKRAGVLDITLQQQLRPQMETIVPLPGIYYQDFIAENQKERADNILPGNNKKEHLEKIRKDIREFKQQNDLDKVIVLWTANTERMCSVTQGVHDNIDNLMRGVESNHPEISPSTIFALATVMEGMSFINGSPQNTIVPGVQELAEQNNVFVLGDDFKSGQTKFKTAFVDYLVSAGIKPKSIVSYNHLGNNDGYNLSSATQFKSKEISKSNCVDDILKSNQVLYPTEKDAHVDHVVVIKYVPSAGDTKKAIDEYESEIFMGGKNTMSTYNVCEDSLLAVPLILDLILITEIFERIEWKKGGNQNYKKFGCVLSLLGYLCKAPLVDANTPQINSLYRQKMVIENVFRVCAGIPVDDNLLLEFRCIQDGIKSPKSE